MLSFIRRSAAIAFLLCAACSAPPDRDAASPSMAVEVVSLFKIEPALVGFVQHAAYDPSVDIPDNERPYLAQHILGELDLVSLKQRSAAAIATIYTEDELAALHGLLTSADGRRYLEAMAAEGGSPLMGGLGRRIDFMNSPQGADVAATFDAFFASPIGRSIDSKAGEWAKLTPIFAEEFGKAGARLFSPPDKETPPGPCAWRGFGRRTVASARPSGRASPGRGIAIRWSDRHAWSGGVMATTSSWPQFQ